MRIFTLWRETGGSDARLSADAVCATVRSLFEPLFAETPRARTLTAGGAAMVFLEIPVRGWKPNFFQADEHGWALAVEYPINARRVLSRLGVRFTEDDVLLTLGRALQSDPIRLLRELAPPFSLVWSDGDAGEVYFQNDALGQAQLFEYQSDRVWALTNKLHTVKALTEPLQLDAEQWAARFALGWFPEDTTGYRRSRFLAPGTQGRVDAGGITRVRNDVLSEWVNPPVMPRAECLELARSSLRNLLEDAIALSDKVNVGLSGGWDSRAVVATLRELDAEFSLRVRGAPARYDVIIAQELAEIAGIDLKVKAAGGLPADDTDGCRRSITRALRWQGGHMSTRKHNTFLVRKPHLTAGSVNIMGQHAGTGKADFARLIHAETLPAHEYENHLVRAVTKSMPSFTRERFRDRARDLALGAYRRADDYELSDLRRLDFFYLYEFTRRWASATVNTQTSVVITPFLNPDFIRACYAFPASELAEKPFHRHITGTCAPDWADVPHTDEVSKGGKRTARIKRAAQIALGMANSNEALRAWKRPRKNKIYDASLYWEQVGAPIIHGAMRAGGFWTDIFDPDLARTEWQSAPDELAIVHLLPETIEASA